MASIVVSGDTSGSITLAAPAVAGSNTLTLPVASDTLVGLAATQTLTNKTLTSPTISSPTISGTPVMSASVITSGTANSSISGATFVDFTGIPSWVKRITVMFNEVSTNGTSPVRIRIGTGGTPQTTGYAGQSSTIAGASAGSTAYAGGGFDFRAGSTQADTRSGNMTLTLLDSATNTWTFIGQVGQTNYTGTDLSSGRCALTGVLNIVRITTVNGTDTFDAGSINILYE